MNKDKPISPEEKELFRATVDGIKPLKGKSRNQDKPKHHQATPHPTAPIRRRIILDSCPPVSAEEMLSYKKSGVNERQFQRLRQAQFPIDARLDLHGLHQDTAPTAIVEQIEDAVAQGHKCIHIIHGKGQGVLKNITNAVLRQHSYVIAFCSAKPQDGGAGAVYVLLKRLADTR